VKVLVTGGSGFIGTRLVRRLLDSGHEVRILDLAVSPEHAGITQVGDVADPRDVDAAVRGVDLVFHLAAEHHDNVLPVSKYHRTNVEGMQALCAAMATHGVSRIVFTSSVAVYGFAMDDVTESQPPAPQNLYGSTKLQAELLLDRWRQDDSKRKVAVIRPCVVFGPGNRGNVYNLFRQVASGRFVMIGDGGNRKSMAYVENIVDALLFLSVHGDNALVNYADKPDLSMNALVAIVGKALGKPATRMRLPKRLGLLVGHGCDLAARFLGRRFSISAVRITKFCAESVVNSDRLCSLGFVPVHRLADAVEATVRFDFPTTSG
jgi:nucleoside-diphosphate-sugar epimerase